jgi:hypothetical protein
MKLMISGMDSNLLASLLKNNLCKNKIVKIVGIMYNDKFVKDIGITMNLGTEELELIEYNSLLTKSKNNKFSEEQVNQFAEELYMKYFDDIYETLQMFDRLILPFSLKFEDRIKITKFLITYWADFIKSKSVEAILFKNTPHEIVDFILYKVAKSSGIKTYIIQSIPNLNLSTIVHDYEDLPENNSNSLNFQDQDREYKDYIINNQIGINRSKIYKDFEPRYMQIPKINKVSYKDSVISKIKMFHNIRQNSYKFDLYELLLNYFYSRILNIRMNQIRKSLESFKCFDEFAGQKKILFALQFQPEMTTSPLGGQYVDQIMAIATLRKYTDKDIVILVKEHPTQIALESNYAGVARPTEYYNTIEKLNNTFMINNETQITDLIEESIAVSTINGTIGFQALCRGKPVITFGYSWYDRLNGCISVGRGQTIPNTEELMSKTTELKENKELLNLEIKEMVHNYFKFIDSEESAEFYGGEWNLEDSLNVFSFIIDRVYNDFKTMN